MSELLRRAFFKCAAVSVGAAVRNAAAQPAQSERIYLWGDGLNWSAADYARLLTQITANPQFRRDGYLHGGAVEELETRMARELGKERALFLPTGTLANHLAVRVLAGERSKVLVQYESHLYRDEGDCAQLLSGLNLVPLGLGRTTLTSDEVIRAVDEADGPPYPAPVGAISIESPVRRRDGQAFDFEELKKICEYARSKHIGTHLDGARVFLAPPYTGVQPSQYASLFDTVYVSLYKYFNAPFGAILAGPAALMARVERLRHQFGTLIYQGWESAAVAVHYMDGFAERFRTAARNGETLTRLLENSSRFVVERVRSGTNIYWIRLSSGQPLDVLAERLRQAGIIVPAEKGAIRSMIQINETLNRRPPDEIAAGFLKASA